MFATAPPGKAEIPECQGWEKDMINEQLGVRFEDCRALLAAAKARIALWETWADGEIEAQRKGRAE
jgi:hypothetical protein